MRPPAWIAPVALGAALGAPGCGTHGEAPLTRATAMPVAAGDRALDAARRTVLEADYLAVHGPRGRTQLFGPGAMVLTRRGRVLVWEDPERSFTRPGGGRCFDRHTEFKREGRAELGVAPPDVVGARLVEREGRRLVLARERHMDFADTEFEIRIDASGRPLSGRQRSAQFGVLPPGRWWTQRYEFLGAAEFARRAEGPPRPLCR